MKKIKHLIEYYALIIFTFFVRLLPLGIARFCARRLGDIAFYLIPIRKKVLINNLTESFKNEKTPKEIKKIAHNVYKQFGQTIMELLFFPKLTRKDIGKMVSLEGLDVIAQAQKSGRGAVLVGAHFGNWELMGAALAQVFPLNYVIGQQENTKVDDILNSYRSNKGINLIPLKMALRGVMKVLKNNQFIAILSDQDAHEDGAFVDFFGRTASTPKGPAMFALRAGSPIIMGTIFRQQNGKFRVIFELIPKPDPTGDEQKDIFNYTQAYTKNLEKHIKQHPDHWFWLHRRWKTKVGVRP